MKRKNLLVVVLAVTIIILLAYIAVIKQSDPVSQPDQDTAIQAKVINVGESGQDSLDQSYSGYVTFQSVSTPAEYLLYVCNQPNWSFANGDIYTINYDVANHLSRTARESGCYNGMLQKTKLGVRP